MISPVKVPPLIRDNLVLNFDPSRGYSPANGVNGILDLSNYGTTIILSNNISYSGNPIAYYASTATSYLEFNTTVSATTFGTGDFTMSWWFYSTNYSAGSHILFDGRTTTSLSSCFAVGINSTGFPYLYSISIVLKSSNSIMLNKWQYVVLSRIGGIIYFYINGVVSGSATYNFNIDSTNIHVWIGKNASGGNAGIIGGIGQVLIYKGLGLTQNQVTQNFNATRFYYGV